MTLKPGTMLGHYEILTLIGVGGMGEVSLSIPSWNQIVSWLQQIDGLRRAA